jgi:hypothetical protein
LSSARRSPGSSIQGKAPLASRTVAVAGLTEWYRGRIGAASGIGLVKDVYTAILPLNQRSANLREFPVTAGTPASAISSAIASAIAATAGRRQQATAALQSGQVAEPADVGDSRRTAATSGKTAYGTQRSPDHSARAAYRAGRGIRSNRIPEFARHLSNPIRHNRPIGSKPPVQVQIRSSGLWPLRHKSSTRHLRPGQRKAGFPRQ